MRWLVLIACAVGGLTVVNPTVASAEVSAIAPHCDTDWVSFRTNEGRDIAVAGSGGSGTRVIIWNPNRLEDQNWCGEGASQGGWYLHPQHNINLCLAVPSSDYTRGKNLIVWGCNGLMDQRFWFDGANPGRIRTMGHSDRCLDTHTPNNGEPVQIWSCNGTLRQAWWTMIG